MTNKNIPGLITVRTSSSRLPNKCLLPFGDCNVIEHVIRRAKHFMIEPIICTSTDSSDDILIEIAKKENVNYFRGSLNNKLLRWHDCANYFGIQDFHTVDADDPFFDGNEMHRSMNLLRSGSYDIVCPTESSSAGGASVGYSLTSKIVHLAIKNLHQDTDTEMMWYFIDKIEKRKSIILDEMNINRPKVRLTLDYEEDYWLLRTIQRLVGSFIERAEIDNLFITNPDLYKINWFHNDEWKNAQLSKKI